MANTTNQGQATREKAKDAVSSAAEKTKDTAHGAIDQAGDFASRMADKASDVASRAASTAGQYASAAGDKVDNAASSVGSGMRTAADSLRDNLPREGMLGRASSSVADTLESGGRYLEDRGLSGVADDLTGLIKRNPIPAVLIALGVGFLLARSTRS
jgi:hypothetical protein